MSREVRRVPADWQHPKSEEYGKEDRYKPLHDGYAEAAAGFLRILAEEGLQEAIDYYGCAPNKNDYMPEWKEEEKTHYQMYETCSEGTPISPVMPTPESLARWLADNEASAFGSMTATYEEWLAMCKAGWAMSAVIENGVFKSGVEALASSKPDKG